MKQRLPRRLQPFVDRHAAMLLFLPVVAWMAIQTHHLGHSWGDDFSLYLRQGKSLLEGNVGQVIADNHFDVDNAAKPGFSPYVYPWGWPLLLAPFLRLWGLAYSNLKLLPVAFLCGFLWILHDLVRRRAGRVVAASVVAFIGTTGTYLAFTDVLLSEFPYLFSVALTLWWIDRIRRHGVRLHEATRNQLITLGLLAVWVFNIRREGLMIVPAIAVAQALDLRGMWRRIPWRKVATPFVTFAVGGVLFQLLLPSAIAPKYEDAGLHQTWTKIKGPWHGSFARQLGFPHLHGVLLAAAALLVVAGIVVRLWKAPGRDAHWVAFVVLSTAMAGMIPSQSQDRYLFCWSLFAVYFAAQAIAAVPFPNRTARWVAAALLLAGAAWHLPDTRDLINSASASRDRGQVVDGPEAEYAQAAFAAVRTYTHQDDVVAFFRVRVLALYTNRRGVQSSDLQIVRQRADYFLSRRNSSFSQPDVSVAQGQAMGWTIVWQDDTWILWRLGEYDGS